MKRPMCVNVSIVAVILCLFSGLAFSQLISIKTIPVVTGDQFLIFPSSNMAMGGLSLAVEDPQRDPYVNPAYASSISTTRVAGTPRFTHITQENGSVRTMPAGFISKFGKWHAGLYGAFQQMSGRQFNPWIGNTLLSDGKLNIYAHGLLSRSFNDGKYALAGSMFWAELNKVSAVDLLYVNSSSVDQFGHIGDIRLGGLARLDDGKTIDAVLLYNRYSMLHTVENWGWGWIDNDLWPSITTQVERNQDRTHSWGAHLGYVQPVGSEGWQWGNAFTTNFKTHPKIPNYDLMQIPRDPGYTYAFNFGSGMFRRIDLARMGFEIVYEPIWSRTWADAAEPIETISGGVIDVGERTIINNFRFHNFHIRMGVGREGKVFSFKTGINMYWISYHLNQEDRIWEQTRDQDEHWIEWKPSLGLSWSFPEFQISYTLLWTAGTGQPGINTWNGGWGRDEGDALSSADFVLAPAGNLTLQEANMFTHQFQISLPIK